MHPLADNPLESRDDFQRAVVDLYEPLRAHASPGGAWVIPGKHAAHYPPPSVGIEGFARPFWGIAPYVAGGGEFHHWAAFRRGLEHGVDPDHPEYWGDGGDYGHIYVEQPAIALTFAMAPGESWDPLDPATRERVAQWCLTVNDVDLYDNNWLFFRVLTNLGLKSVGVTVNDDAVSDSLDRLEGFYRDDGWYADGPDGGMDYYNPWAMHTYGLLYAALAGDTDPDRATRFRERAIRFARSFRSWFADDGAGIPYGRSLTYRFAQATFWGALAYADVEGIDLGEVRGLWQRNLQWWASRPIFTNDGILSVGYGYPNIGMMERYNSPSAPYWAMKAFLPLALEESHPFWQATPAPQPPLPPVSVQEQPGMVLCRQDGDVVALTAGQDTRFPEKYAKYAYSTRFGFGVRSGRDGLGGAAHDNALALSRDEPYWRTPREPERLAVTEDHVHRRWRPWEDVTVETWLVPGSPWHSRLHRIDSDGPLRFAAGGFPVADPDRSEIDPVIARTSSELLVEGSNGASGIRSLAGPGEATLVTQDPNTNVLCPRTSVPTVRGTVEPGEAWLHVAVTGGRSPDHVGWEDAVDRHPDTVPFPEA